MRTVWDIIKSPVITEKALAAKEESQDTRQLLTFRVDRRATKPEIKSAVETIFQVKVDHVKSLVKKKCGKTNVSKLGNGTKFHGAKCREKQKAAYGRFLNRARPFYFFAKVKTALSFFLPSSKLVHSSVISVGLLNVIRSECIWGSLFESIPSLPAISK